MTFTPSDARAAWDEGASAWEQFVESGADFYRTEVHGPALLEVCGDVEGLRVLDLGCGQGWFTRQLAGQGAHAIGVDISPEMLGHARRHERERPLGIEYIESDAAAVDERWPEGAFDLVTGCMSIQDMPDPGAAIRVAVKVLTVGGRLVFSVPHPFTEMTYREWERDQDGNKIALKVDRYFDTGTRNFSWDMSRLRYSWSTPEWGLTLGEWSEHIARAGLLVSRIHEPRPTSDQVRNQPALEDCRRLPYFLIFECARWQRQLT